MHKIIFLSMISIMSGYSIHADSCGELKAMDERLACFDTLAKCASVKSDAQRLVCFESGKKSTPEVQKAHRDTIESQISSTRMNRSEVLHIFLENGQVWKETTRSRFRYKEGQKVTITKTSSGATRLHAEGMKKYAKVRQVK